MKRFNLFASLIVAAMVMSSCGSNKTVKSVALNTMQDSLSYAFAAASTDGLVKELKIDSTYIDAFIEGVLDAKKELTPKEKAYNMGLQIGTNIAGENGLQSIGQMLFGENADSAFNEDAFYDGFVASIKGEGLKMTVEEAMQYRETQVTALRKATSEKEFGSNKLAGEAYLDSIKGVDGVVATGSGLLYQVIKMGNGPKPSNTDVVKCHYHGMLIDGTVFDSSVDRGEPIEMSVSQFIPGWIEALQLMPVGSKWKLYIPYDLAYGERSAGQIKPYSALVFEMELLEIVKK